MVYHSESRGYILNARTLLQVNTELGDFTNGCARYIRAYIDWCASLGIPRRASGILRSEDSISRSPPLIFAGPTLERIDTRQDYGEVRRIALGIADEIRSPWSIPIGLRLAKSCDESFRPE